MKIVRVYFPPDANCLLSVMDHCLRSRHYVNVIVAGKHPAPQWLTMDVAQKHCTEGIGIWPWASNDAGEKPDAVMACDKGLLRAVPAAVPGGAFLSGGQSPEQATAHLNAMNSQFAGRLPWALTFSFGRALQQPALAIWKGDDMNREAAQQALFDRASSNRAARRGQYRAEIEV